MSFTNAVLAVVYGLSMWSTTSSATAPSDTLKVHITIEFDAAIKSPVAKAVAMRETTAIWKPYDVELLWSDEQCDAALHLDVIVGGHQPGTILDGSPAVLGTTTVMGAGRANGPIRISSEAIEWLLVHRPETVPALHDQELGRALGRVLAHEIGHVLLGTPTYHDSKGLMRARIPIHELGRFDRGGLRLSAASARRLRDQISHVTETPAVESGSTTWSESVSDDGISDTTVALVSERSAVRAVSCRRRS
jgi:hypothetical protein